VSRSKNIGAVVCLVAFAFFAGWPVWKWLSVRSASSNLQTRTQALVEKNPQLQLAWTVAMQDEVLTYPEAKIIVEAAGEKVDPNE
jgi:hypothetical protein